MFQLSLFKGLCESTNVIITFQCACLVFFVQFIYIFSIRVSSLYSYFLCYSYFGTSSFHIPINSSQKQKSINEKHTVRKYGNFHSYWMQIKLHQNRTLVNTLPVKRSLNASAGIWLRTFVRSCSSRSRDAWFAKSAVSSGSSSAMANTSSSTSSWWWSKPDHSKTNSQYHIKNTKKKSGKLSSKAWRLKTGKTKLED